MLHIKNINFWQLDILSWSQKTEEASQDIDVVHSEDSMRII